MSIVIHQAKLVVVFKASELPSIDPANPRFTLDLGGVRIAGSINAKAARKLASHNATAVLQGKLVAERGQLVLLEAGFQFLDPPKPADPTAEAPVGGAP